MNVAQRGFHLYPALLPFSLRTSWFDAPRLGIVLALLGNLGALALWRQAWTAPRLPWVELTFSLLLFVFASPALVRRSFDQAKQGVYGAELIALIAAFSALAIGVTSVIVCPRAIPLTPNFLLRFGARPDGATALAFESAGAIIGFGFLTQQVRETATRKAFGEMERMLRIRYARVRRLLPQGGEVLVPCAYLVPGDRLRLLAGEVALLDMRLDVAARVVTSSGRMDDRASGQTVFRGERLVSVVATGRLEQTLGFDAAAAADAEVAREARRLDGGFDGPTEDRLENIIALALNFATVWFAVFALIAHAIAGRHALHPGVTLAGVAVLVGASSAAFLCGLPIARSAAILRARSMGAVVKNVAALEALASIDCAFFDLSGPYYFDAHTTCRALWHRAIGCRILSENHAEAAQTMAHRFGVATSVQIDTEAKTRIVQTARLGGARVLLVGPDDTARMIPVDVPIAVAPDALVGSVSSPIVLRESSLKSLVWLIDTARQLRSRKRLLLAMTLAYDVFVIPLCVAGFLAPMVAAALAFGVAWSSCRLASSIGSKPDR